MHDIYSFGVLLRINQRLRFLNLPYLTSVILCVCRDEPQNDNQTSISCFLQAFAKFWTPKQAMSSHHGWAMVSHLRALWITIIDTIYIKSAQFSQVIPSSCCRLTWPDYIQTESFYVPPLGRFHLLWCDSCFSTWHIWQRRITHTAENIQGINSCE